MWQWLIIIAVVGVVAGDAPKWSSCDSSGRANITAVSASCPEKDGVAQLKRGTDVSFTVGFLMESAASSAEVEVYATIQGMTYQLPVPNPDACTGSGLTCPLKKGSNYKYSKQIPIKDTFPPMDVDIKWSLVNEQKQPIWCMAFKAQIV